MGNSMSFDRCAANASFNVSTTKDIGDNNSLADPTDVLALSLADTLAAGRGNNQGNLLWFDSGTLAASASKDYDLVASLQTVYGDTVNFDLVKGILVKNTSTAGDAAIIRVIGQNFNTWLKAATDYVRVYPRGIFLLWNPTDEGYDVSAGSDTIRLTNESASLEAIYEIALIGVEIDSSSSSSSSSFSRSFATASGSSELITVLFSAASAFSSCRPS